MNKIKTNFTREMIEDHQDDLTPEHFQVLIAAWAGDQNGAAKEIGIPLGTFKSRLHRARVALADLMLKADVAKRGVAVP